MMLLPTKSTRSGVSTGDFFTSGSGVVWPKAAGASRASVTPANRAAIVRFMCALLIFSDRLLVLAQPLEQHAVESLGLLDVGQMLGPLEFVVAAVREQAC